MLARINDDKFIYLEQITQGTEEALVNWFSVRHPRAYFIDTSADWDGWYRRYNVSKQRLALPFLSELKDCCGKHKIPLEIVDERPAPIFPAPQKKHITDTFLNGITLEAHQVRGLHAACDEDIGLYDIKTGGGKTMIMCGLIKMYRCPTLVITEQIVVLEQIVERLKIMNVVYNDDIGLFCHGHMPDDNLVMVGSIQSIMTPASPPTRPKKVSKTDALKDGLKWIKNGKLREIFPKKLWETLEDNPKGIKALTGHYLQVLVNAVSKSRHEAYKHWYKVRRVKSKELQTMAKKCDLLMVDEADKATSDMYRPLFQHYFKGRRRYGFSGTPTDPQKPVQNLLLKERLGSVICKASRKELQDIGRIIPIEFIMLGFGEDGDKRDSTAFDIAEREVMIENEIFHSLVCKIVSNFKNNQTMILVDTSAIEELGFVLEELIPNSKFIYGKTSKTARRKYIKMFEEKELACLIGGKILKRGLDLKGGCDNLILVGGGRLQSDFDQKIGRALRQNERGRARVFDFLFLNNKYLYSHSRSRLKAIVEMEYKSRVVVGGQEIDGERFVKSRFRIPKRK